MDNEQWFELPEDIDNTVKYEIYLSRQLNDQTIKTIQKHVSSIVSGYTLKLELNPKQNLCYGNLKFDGKIEEEWLIVYLLYELSKLDDDLVIKVYDNDGDILLIEAADYLPHWLESSKSENRVFIHKGRLHIIPESVNLKSLLKDKETSTITNVASQFIRDKNKSTEKSDTLAKNSIQDAITEQLSGMPNKERWLSKKFKLLDEIISNSTT